MPTPKTRARRVRGVLVGASSAVTTVGAHVAAGGGLPHGAALVLALMLCATVAALLARVRIESRGARWLATTAALGAAQGLGHLALTVTDHQHGDCLVPGPSMTALHLGAAVVLGGAIAAAEYLYVVCSSVLCWLRLFARRAPRPAARIRRQITNVIVVRPVLASGMGMRAPPRTAVTA